MSWRLVAVLILWSATVGRTEGAEGRRLFGEVVGPDGRAAPGSVVIAAAGDWDGRPPRTIGRGVADDSGRFEIELSEDPTAMERPAAWAIRPGSVAASSAIGRDSSDSRKLRLTLGTTAGAAFVVAGPDGRAIEGASVVPDRVAREPGRVPAEVARLASATTDRDGHATVSAFRPEELLEARVDAPGFGSQPRDFRCPGGLARVGIRSVSLLPAGRVVGRVVADEAGSAAGLVVRVSSASGGRGGPESGFAEVATDGMGRFEVPSIAGGLITVRVRPGAGSRDLPARAVRKVLEPGHSVEVEVPLRRGVRVVGRAVDDRDGRPIAGVVVSVVPSAPAEPTRVRTDADGWYEAFVPAGLASHRVLSVPAPYLAPPEFVGPRPVEVPPAIARFELPRIELARGVEVRGRVADHLGRPAAGAWVEASWTLFDGRTRAPRSTRAVADRDGTFEVGPVAPRAEVSIAAGLEGSKSTRPVRVPADGAGVGEVTLTLDEPAGGPTGGRVVDPDGRPIAGASVRIWGAPRPVVGPVEGYALVEFDGPDRVETDESGRFEVPGRLALDREYRAIVSAPGFMVGESRPIRPGDPAEDASKFPEVVLFPEPVRVAIEGRVRDRSGRPVAGASVRTSGDGPCRRRAVADASGRFRLDAVAEGTPFLFVEADGYRFQGARLGRDRGPVDVVLTRLDEPPASTMTTLPLPHSGPELARRVLAPYLDRVLTDGDHSTKIRTLERAARVDPARVLALVASDEIDDPRLADHLRHAASRGMGGSAPEERLAAVELIRDAEWRAVAALDAADDLPGSAQGPKREWIELALRDARSIADPPGRVEALARVADRMVDLGDLARARRLFRSTLPLVERLPTATRPGRARVAFAEALARVDPPRALALTEGVVDPREFDRCRLRIACRMAASGPDRVASVLDSLRDPRSLARDLPALCHALAAVDPPLARRLIERSRPEDPCVPAYALGMMALAVADSDKAAATSWLREAFARLGDLAATGAGAHDPAAVAAALLPVAERIDPGLVPELFWKAASLHASGPGGDPRESALLALLLARYDREVALAFFDPSARRAEVDAREFDLGLLVAASVVLDPASAVRVVERMPEAPDLTFHHPKNEARLALADALARKGPECWADATSRFLRLWVDGVPERN